MRLTQTAFAKINLALHVRRRRDDGYHELETLFAFLDAGDALEVEPAPEFQLNLLGEFGGQLTADDDNLVVRAIRMLHGGDLPSLNLFLAKDLPVAAGLGGGSADAAAALRLFGADDRLDLAAELGADVPACVASVPVIGTGTGTDLTPVVNDVSGLACILVNPLIPLPTGPVFQAWDGTDRGAMPSGSAREIMLAGRNDLEAPATSICPQIASVLAYLQGTDPLVARMSGSGASCFAIYEDYDVAAKIESHMRKIDHQDWWIMLGTLR